MSAPPDGSAGEVVLTLADGYRFDVAFEPEAPGTFAMDEPPPLGAAAGPTASLVLAAAVANCLSASLLFCLRKARVDVRGMRTVAAASTARNERGRLRLRDVRVSIHPAVAGDLGRLQRCLDLFEDYCVVTESVRHGLPVAVEVRPEPADAQPPSHRSDRLPRAAHVLAVCAHPDDESFGLGAVLDAFTRAGSPVSVLSFTHGESGHSEGAADLGSVRAAELTAAATALGVDQVRVLDYPDGGLAAVPLDELAGRLLPVITATRADLLVAFDDQGITTHPDHRQATAAALAAGQAAGLPVLAWTLPADVASTLNAEYGTAFAGTAAATAGFAIEVDRARQWRAIAAHRSQAGQLPLVARRLELLGNRERLRWLAAGTAGTAGAGSA